MLDFKRILVVYYPEDTPLRRLLIRHSEQVREKALALCPAGLDRDFVSAAAMLHDLGICRCHAPGILCIGTEHYLAHGLIGGAMLREYGAAHRMELEAYARVCERHTGTGITAREIKEQHLPLPLRDFLPETPEEKLICYADKFFSKSGDMLEKTPEHIRRGLAKFGPDTLARFDEMARQFGV